VQDEHRAAIFFIALNGHLELPSVPSD
jgi:hypothetical protein